MTIELLEDSNLIVVMVQKHKKEIIFFSNGRFKKEIVILNIPDLYKYYQKELIQILEEKTKTYLT